MSNETTEQQTFEADRRTVLNMIGGGLRAISGKALSLESSMGGKDVREVLGDLGQTISEVAIEDELNLTAHRGDVYKMLIALGYTPQGIRTKVGFLNDYEP